MAGGRKSAKDAEPDVDCSRFDIDLDDKSIACEKRGTGSIKLIFTHGAGGGIDSPAMTEFSTGFADHGAIVCFAGTMNLKSRVKYYHAVIEHEKCQAIGGRSMGARAAVMARSDQSLILVSYPLVAKTNRDQILIDLEDGDVLFVVGEHDKMCPVAELNKVRKKMKATTWLLEIKGADHGMNCKPKSATEAMRQETGKQAAQWLEQRPENHDGVMEWDGERSVTLWT